MPIPQLEKKRSSGTSARHASEVRKKRALGRNGRAASPAHHRFSVHGLFHDPTAWWKKNRASLFKGAMILLAACVLLGITGVGAAYAWVSKDLADIADIQKRLIAQSTKIYARDGQTLLYELGDNHRIDVDISKISPDVVRATIALEDHGFYNHHGFDPVSIMRAAIANVTNRGIAQGGSTITQQLIGNTVLTKEQTFTRKVKELILAIRLERKYSKDQIMNMYLNEVYYGPNEEGVESAATRFFGKHANEVTLAQAATLAALPQRPVYFMNNRDALQSRRNAALDQMTELGYITREQAAAAQQEELNMNETVSGINAPHFVFYVQGYLEDTYGLTRARKEGLKVVTTLDWDKQQKAEQAIDNGMEKVRRYGGSNAALVTLDAHNGQILAMVGSHDWFDKENEGEFNVTTALRQPGSSIKPVVYLTAFDKGYIPETKLFDVQTEFPNSNGGKTYTPYNFDNSSHGLLTLRYALDQSYNIPAVKLLYLVGVDAAVNTAEKLGYTSFQDRSRIGLSMVLGGAEVSLLEHTAAYATYAREGEHHTPAAILRVEDRSGNVLEEWKDNSKQAIDKNSVRILNDVLSDAASRGSVFAGLNLSGRPNGAKTGTSNDFRDAWAMGYTPSIATGVWTGNNDFSPMKNLGDGIVIAAPIWKAYMDSILDGTPVETFNEPSYKAANDALAGNLETAVERTVDSVTGEIIPDDCLAAYPETYKTKKTFKEAHEILHYISKEDPKGDAPKDPTKDPMYAAWEKGVQEWLAKNNLGEYVNGALPQTPCDLRDPNQQPTVTITAPTDGGVYSKKTLTLSADVKPGKNRTIVKVEFYIDVVKVDEQADLAITKSHSVTSTYKPKNLTAGKHTVFVRVTDERGNAAEATTQIQFE